MVVNIKQASDPESPPTARPALQTSNSAAYEKITEAVKGIFAAFPSATAKQRDSLRKWVTLLKSRMTFLITEGDESKKEELSTFLEEARDVGNTDCVSEAHETFQKRSKERDATIKKVAKSLAREENDPKVSKHPKVVAATEAAKDAASGYLASINTVTAKPTRIFSQADPDFIHAYLLDDLIRILEESQGTLPEGKGISKAEMKKLSGLVVEKNKIIRLFERFAYKYKERFAYNYKKYKKGCDDIAPVMNESIEALQSIKGLGRHLDVKRLMQLSNTCRNYLEENRDIEAAHKQSVEKIGDLLEQKIAQELSKQELEQYSHLFEECEDVLTSARKDGVFRSVPGKRLTGKLYDALDLVSQPLSRNHIQNYVTWLSDAGSADEEETRLRPEFLQLLVETYGKGNEDQALFTLEKRASTKFGRGKKSLETLREEFENVGRATPLDYETRKALYPLLLKIKSRNTQGIKSLKIEIQQEIEEDKTAIAQLEQKQEQSANNEADVRKRESDIKDLKNQIVALQKAPTGDLTQVPPEALKEQIDSLKRRISRIQSSIVQTTKASQDYSESGMSYQARIDMLNRRLAKNRALLPLLLVFPSAK